MCWMKSVAVLAVLAVLGVLEVLEVLDVMGSVDVWDLLLMVGSSI